MHSMYSTTFYKFTHFSKIVQIKDARGVSVVACVFTKVA